MRGGESQLALDFGGRAGGRSLRTLRKVRREREVRLVEFAPFPRARRGQQWERGFTLDHSPQGLCLRAKEAVAEGSLLHVILRGVDGRPILDAVGRIAWCRRRSGSGALMGLELIASKRPRRHAAPLAHRDVAA